MPRVFLCMLNERGLVEPPALETQRDAKLEREKKKKNLPQLLVRAIHTCNGAASLRFEATRGYAKRTNIEQASPRNTQSTSNERRQPVSIVARVSINYVKILLTSLAIA